MFREIRTEVLNSRFNNLTIHHEISKVRKLETNAFRCLFRHFVLSAFRGSFVFVLIVQTFQMTKKSLLVVLFIRGEY